MPVDRTHAPGLALLAALIAPLLGACPESPYPEQRVDLTPRAPAAASPQPTESDKLRFSVGAMLSPQDSLAAYSHLFALVAKRTGYEVEFVQRKTYREVNELLATGRVDAALIGTGAWLELERRSPGKVQLLAVPMVGGRATYSSIVVVPASSRARTLADLEGKRFACTDELSLTGHAYAVHWLRSHRLDPARFFRSVQFTGSHERSIEAVAKGLVDGACMSSLVFDGLERRRPQLAGALRVIEVSPPFGAPPVVVSVEIPDERRWALRRILMGLTADIEGRQALAAIGFDRFATVTPAHYDAARAAMEAIR